MAVPYKQLTPLQLQAEYDAVKEAFEAHKAKGLKLNMSRGKPGTAQLNLVSDMLNVLADPKKCVADHLDVRNYGELAGLPAAKQLFSELLGCRAEEVFVGGNSSLNLMYDTITRGYTHGLLHSPKPWCREETIKWLCPVPGYDRHFAITELYGFEMINIPMLATGPDMDLVESLVKDPAVKGMWCVPKFSNPEGVIYSAETVARIAALKPAAPDFTIMWDNAYCIHEFACDYVEFPDILSLCREAGNPDMVYEFASTSKVTFPGAGISVMVASVDNLKHAEKILTLQTISYDKVNQLRHVRFLKDKETTLALMRRHAEIMNPKFEAVLRALDEQIAPLDIAEWKRPLGGYFISLDTAPGLATRTLALCKQAGVVMTPAGATFPYGKDPQDRNIRIAPSLPPVAELEQAIAIFCTCLRMAALEQLMAQ